MGNRRLIIEDEQRGETRAEYGKAVLKNLSEQLTQQFGKGFTVRNLRNMRDFYSKFPKRHALRTELSWTHYRTLLRIDDEAARNWYMMNEAVSENWSSRALERQQRISTDDEDFYIDLVFYNFKLKCFLLIDLKMGKLSHQERWANGYLFAFTTNTKKAMTTTRLSA